MKVAQAQKLLGLNPITLPAPDKIIEGGYTGDLLSWVMGRASEGDAWITIMSNVNIVAVCTLADPACIILSEGVMPDAEAKKRAEEQGVNILTTDLDTFSACARIAALL